MTVPTQIVSPSRAKLDDALLTDIADCTPLATAWRAFEAASRTELIRR